MKILRIVVGICLILAVAWAVLLRARRGTESMAALRKFRYAHRGLYDKEAGIPENSLPAFSRARSRGASARSSTCTCCATGRLPCSTTAM